MRLLIVGGLLFVLSACASSSVTEQDRRADTALGLSEPGQDEHDHEARNAIREYQAQQQEDQKQLLERQITDPLA